MKAKKTLIERNYADSIVGISTKDIKSCLDLSVLRDWLSTFDYELHQLKAKMEYMESTSKDPFSIHKLYRYIGVQKSVRSQLIGQIQYLKDVDRNERNRVVLKRCEMLCSFLKEKLILHVGSKDLVYQLIDDFMESEEYKMGYSKRKLNKMKHSSFKY